MQWLIQWKKYASKWGWQKVGLIGDTQFDLGLGDWELQGKWGTPGGMRIENPKALCLGDCMQGRQGILQEIGNLNFLEDGNSTGDWKLKQRGYESWP